MTNDVLEAALFYASKGWKVLPLHVPVFGNNGVSCSCHKGDKCKSIGKHPYEAFVPRGLKDASADRGTLVHWFGNSVGNTNLNIGIVTGSTSGIGVFDFDIRNYGTYSFEEVEEKCSKLPETIQSLTGGGGYHLVFRLPSGVILPNSVGKIAPGVDFRGENGMIVGPPSKHYSGSDYVWEITLNPYDMEPAELPASWVEFLAAVPLPDRTANVSANSQASDLPISKQALQFISFGAPIGTQRDRALSAARSLLGAGYTIDVATQKVWAGLQASEQDKARGEWTYEEAAQIVSDLASKPSKAPAPLKKKAVNPSKIGRDSLTDVGNGKRLVAGYGKFLHYCDEWGRWLIWNGKRWEIDKTVKIESLAKKTAAGIYDEAKSEPDMDRKAALAKWAVHSESRFAISAMVDMAKSEPDIAIESEQLDQDNWLLNVRNGTIDLRSGALKPHSASDLITKLAPVEFDPGAVSQTWLGFLDYIFEGDQDLIAFVRRAIGYAATGVVTEKALFFLYGPGGDNGKTTFLNAILGTLGESYAMQMNSDILMQSNSERHPTSLAALRGMRFITTVEVNQGRRIAEALVKQLTGMDKIRARFMRMDEFEFWPTHKIFLAANDKPIISSSENAIWNRIKLIPFMVKIPKSKMDKTLSDRLRKERAGILNWIIQGCLEWQRVGLDEPQTVLVATQEYRSEMDNISRFIEECCVKGPNLKISKYELYRKYTEWCTLIGERYDTQPLFGRSLQRMGYREHKGTAGTRFWLGLDWQNDEKNTAQNDNATEVPEGVDFEAKSGVSGTSGAESRLSGLGVPYGGIRSFTPLTPLTPLYTQEGTAATPTEAGDQAITNGIPLGRKRVRVDRELMDQLIQDGMRKEDAIKEATIEVVENVSGLGEYS